MRSRLAPLVALLASCGHLAAAQAPQTSTVVVRHPVVHVDTVGSIDSVVTTIVLPPVHDTITQLVTRVVHDTITRIDTLRITSVPPTPPIPQSVPPSLVQVPLAVRRFDGGNGPVLVSNGIPLTPGLVTPTTLAQLHVRVAGVEQPIAVRALGGTFPDGSLRAVLVQFTYPIPDTASIAAQLVLGGARTLASPALVATSSAPAAAALPTAPSYLIATRQAGGLPDPAATWPAASAIAMLEGDFARLEAGDWARCGASWSCGRTAGYDRAFILFTAWMRTANPTYWRHATLTAADYYKNYIVPNVAPTPWWSQSEGLALAYWATGDEPVRYQVRKMAEALAYMVRAGSSYAPGGTYGDDRFTARVLTAAMDAAALGIATQPADAGTYYPASGGVASVAFYAPYLTPTTLPTWITAVLAQQQASGAFGGAQYGGGEKNYMVGMLLSALVRYYDEVTPDPRIPSAVRRATDYMWANEWHADSLGFKYVSFAVKASGTNAAEDPQVFPDLNSLILPAFAWQASRTHDPIDIARVDQQLQGLLIARAWWANSGKSFDQGWYRLLNTFAWRAAAGP